MDLVRFPPFLLIAFLSYVLENFLKATGSKKKPEHCSFGVDGFENNDALLEVKSEVFPIDEWVHIVATADGGKTIFSAACRMVTRARFIEHPSR